MVRHVEQTQTPSEAQWHTHLDLLDTYLRSTCSLAETLTALINTQSDDLSKLGFDDAVVVCESSKTLSNATQELMVWSLLCDTARHLQKQKVYLDAEDVHTMQSRFRSSEGDLNYVFSGALPPEQIIAAKRVIIEIANREGFDLFGYQSTELPELDEIKSTLESLKRVMERHG